MSKRKATSGVQEKGAGGWVVVVIVVDDAPAVVMGDVVGAELHNTSEISTSAPFVMLKSGELYWKSKPEES